MEPFAERLIEEKNQLDLKIQALARFIDSAGEVYEGLSEAEKSRLRSQRYYMNGYAETLNQRIEALYEANQ